MKNLLIIVAHPKESSLTHAMALRFQVASKEANKSVDFIDLYRCEMQQEFFHFDESNQIEPTPQMRYFQEKIKKADEIAFFFPNWWGGFPAILKNFIDWNFSSGFAFTYEKGRPKGLLTDKRVKVFTTMGTPNFIATLNGSNRRLKATIQKQIIEFCGMQLVTFRIYGGVDTKAKHINSIFEDLLRFI